jgi:hypothetical protein
MDPFETNCSYRLTTVFAASDLGLFSAYPPETESFHSYWDTCREQFGKKFIPTTSGFFLTVYPEQIENVPNFINLCENLLELKTRTKYYLTENPSIIFITPSYFWRKCYMRRSLLSLLCRQGMFFTQKSKFEDHLFGNVDDCEKDKISNSYKFARETQEAILRFFSGYPVYIGNGPNMDEYFPEKHGWVQEFKKRSKEYVKEMLKGESETVRIYSFFGKNLVLP